MVCVCLVLCRSHCSFASPSLSQLMVGVVIVDEVAVDTKALTVSRAFIKPEVRPKTAQPPTLVTSPWVPHAALLVYQLICSMNLIITRAAFSFQQPGKEKVKPIVLAVSRCIIATTIFFSLRSSRRACRPSNSPTLQISARDRCSIVLLGICGIPVTLCGYLYGAALTDAITVSASSSMLAPVTYLIARAFNMESFSALKSWSIPVLVLGNCMMVSVWKLFIGNNNSSVESAANAHVYYIGCLVLIVSVVSFSIYLVFQKPVLQRVDRLEFLFYFYGAGCAGLVAIALIDVQTLLRQLFGGHLSTWSWIIILFAGCIQSTIPDYLILFAVAKGGSSVLVAAYTSLQPVTIAVLAVFLLGEEMTMVKAVGSLVVLAGLAMNVFAQCSEAQKNPPAVHSDDPPLKSVGTIDDHHHRDVMIYEEIRVYAHATEELPMPEHSG